MSQVPNQFSQSVVKGLADQRLNPFVIPCRVADNEATPLVPGQAVKLADVAGGAPVVTAVAADTDKIFGVVSYNIRDKNFPASSHLEVISYGSVVYMTASAAIARGADVMYVVTDEEIATATPGKSILGMALDKAAADGDLIRVLILEPEFKSAALIQQGAIADLDQTISGSYDQAEVQAISDKVDALLAALRLAGVIASA